MHCEREAEAKADDLKKERAANIAAEWGLPWPPPDRKGKWGRMSNESKLYAQIPCGIEQEPSYPPPSGKSSSTSSSLAESSDLPVGNKDTGSSSTSNSSHNLQQVPSTLLKKGCCNNTLRGVRTPV